MYRSLFILILSFFISFQMVWGQDHTPDTPVLDSVSVVYPVNGDVYISWFPSDSANVSSYIIYRSINTLWQTIATVLAPSTSYVDTNAHADFHPELYRIAAKTIVGVDTFISPMTPQGKYHNTIYLFPYQDSINCQTATKLSWNKYLNWAEGVNYYQIYFSENSGPWSLLSTTAANTSIYFHENILDNTPYCYFIRAVSNLGRTSTSNKACSCFNLPDPPQFVYADYATVAGDQKIDLSFTVDSTGDYKNYRIYRSAAISGPYTLIKTYPNYNDKKILYSDYVDVTKKWFYKLTAFDRCGNDILESNIARNITVHVTSNEDLIEQVSWDRYLDWLQGVEIYNIYRVVDDWAPVLAGTITNSDTIFLDDVSDYAINRTGATGNFCYFIEAVEGSGNPYATNCKSQSNRACASQFDRVFLPNTFTPDGDELNAEFLPIVSFVRKENYYFSVFDRWGEKMFETTDPIKGWDGKFNGNKVKGGTYVYVFRYMNSNAELKEKSGYIYLFYP